METIIGAFIEPLVERVLSSLMKPSNLKSRMNTIKAYTVYYPLYKALSCLGNHELHLKIVRCMLDDPSIITFTCILIGQGGVLSRYIIQREEAVKRVAAMLYVPPPLMDELKEDREIRTSLEKTLSLLEKGKLGDAQNLVHQKFREKFEAGDIQVVFGEDLIDEALTLILAMLELSDKVSKNSLQVVERNYYTVSIMEKMFSQFPFMLYQILSLFIPPPMHQSLSENMKKITEFFSGRNVMLNPHIENSLRDAEKRLGFSYEDFKKAFEKMEESLRRI